MFRQFIVVSALLLACSSATNVKQCKKGPLPLSVNIEGCEELPCIVIKGTTAVMDVHFVGVRDNTQKLTTKVRATALGITVPYELPADVADVCSNLMYGATCPLDKDEDVIYKFNFFIDSSYPEISAKVEVSLIDETTEAAACFIADIKVRKGAINPMGSDGYYIE